MLAFIYVEILGVCSITIQFFSFCHALLSSLLQNVISQSPKVVKYCNEFVVSTYLTMLISANLSLVNPSEFCKTRLRNARRLASITHFLTKNVSVNSAYFHSNPFLYNILLHFRSKFKSYENIIYQSSKFNRYT